MPIQKDISKEYYFSIPKHIKYGEEIIIFARPHLLSIFSEIILIVVFLLVPGALLIILSYIFAGSGISFLANKLYMNIFILSASAYYLAAAFFALAEWMNYYYDILIVTKTHLIDINQKTIFDREISQLHLSQIEDVTSQIRGIFPTLFAFGNVVVQTAGAMENTIIKNIPNPQKVSTQIIELQSQSLGKSPLSLPKASIKNQPGRFVKPGEKNSGKRI